MGVTFKIEDGYVTGSIDGRLKGANINLNKISVGATENLIMAATLAEGTTIITNAAQEPEISDLSKLLIRMGANIKGFGTKKIVIDGVKNLKVVLMKLCLTELNQALIYYASLVVEE